MLEGETSKESKYAKEVIETLLSIENEYSYNLTNIKYTVWLTDNLKGYESAVVDLFNVNVYHKKFPEINLKIEKDTMPQILRHLKEFLKNKGVESC